MNEYEAAFEPPIEVHVIAPLPAELGLGPSPSGAQHQIAMAHDHRM